MNDRIEDYIKKFIEVVYPEAPDLALQTFNEKVCVQDATTLICELKAEIERLKMDNLDLRTPCIHAENGIALENMAKVNSELMAQVRHLSGDCRLCHPAEHEERIKDLQAQLSRMRESLENIREVAEARIKSKVAYTSGSMGSDNKVYFKLSDEALTQSGKEDNLEDSPFQTGKRLGAEMTNPRTEG